MTSPVPEPSANPFETPKSAEADEAAANVDHYGSASQGQRFLNLIIDSLGARFTISLAVQMLLVRFLITGLPAVFASVGCSFAYYILLEGLTGRTLGKLVTGTKVIAEDGGRPGIGKVVIRTLVRFVPFEPFSFLSSDAIGWHDEWSHTRVVRLRPGKLDRP